MVTIRLNMQVDVPEATKRMLVFSPWSKISVRTILRTVRLGESEIPVWKDSASTFSTQNFKLQASTIKASNDAMVKLFLSSLLIGSATAFAPAPSTHRTTVAVNGAAMDELKIIAEMANPKIKVRMLRSYH